MSSMRIMEALYLNVDSTYNGALYLNVTSIRIMEALYLNVYSKYNGALYLNVNSMRIMEALYLNVYSMYNGALYLNVWYNGSPGACMRSCRVSNSFVSSLLCIHCTGFIFQKIKPPPSSLIPSPSYPSSLFPLSLSLFPPHSSLPPHPSSLLIPPFSSLLLPSH